MINIGQLIRDALKVPTNEEVWVRVDGIQYPVSGVFLAQRSGMGIVIEADQAMVDLAKSLRGTKKGKKDE